MIKVSMNIIGNGSAFNHCPMFWEFETAREFTDFIRENVLEILNWSHTSFASKSKTKLGVHIVEDVSDESYWEWDFIIECSNIREFKSCINLSREDFESVFESHQRDKKIKNILYDQE